VAFWKKIAIGLGVLVVLGVIGGVAAYRLTAVAANAATAFVETIAKSGPDAAYRDAAPALRLAQSEAAFSAQVRQWRLTDAASENWPSRTYQDGRYTVTGSVTLRSGETIPLRIVLVKVGDKWEVAGLALDAGAQNNDMD
jgi:hypothetical protein